VRVEAELVDAVVPGDSLTQESGNGGDPLRQIIQRGVAGRGAGGAAVFVDFANHRGDLLGRRAAIRIRK
jgi:hypothetical protein